MSLISGDFNPLMYEIRPIGLKHYIWGDQLQLDQFQLFHKTSRQNVVANMHLGH